MSYEDMVGNKNYKFFKQVNESGYYEIDTEKIEQDEKLDGFYVYETNRQDLLLIRLLISMLNNERLKIILEV
ncbi:hypothetical protein VBM87_01550 [Mycoplasma sp. 744]|uniref:hypothetical protein n=1 Tax=Mycoplasma sp. 744 TaxID=3108531 RepID=UPI002B1DB52B|nr:hypothetical protein [Mycoplasma sp. 744]MEA4115466.1 hypothetical protein [Mycoplasma sp. 744]